MKKLKKNNIVSFPSSLSEGEKEIEAILFAAEEPLDVESIQEPYKNYTKPTTKL